MTNEQIQALLAAELAVGEAIRNADVDAKIARRKELGLSLICTLDELDATPMPEDYKVLSQIKDKYGGKLPHQVRGWEPK